METDYKKLWGLDMEQLSKEMIDYAKNYKCKICEGQPEFAWCKHLLRDRANKFRERIKEADAKLMTN